jgi:hypothetical protein
MAQGKIQNSGLDRMIRNAFVSDERLAFPRGLADLTIRKLEKKMLLRRLLVELLAKAALILGSLALLAGVLFCVNGAGLLTAMQVFLAQNSQLVASVLILGIITILIDQVLLRYYTTFNVSR